MASPRYSAADESEGTLNASHSFAEDGGILEVTRRRSRVHSRHQFRMLPRHGKAPGTTPCRLRWPRYGSCNKYSAAERKSQSDAPEHTETYTKVYDLHQETMQVLSNVALVYVRVDEGGADTSFHAHVRMTLESLAEVSRRSGSFTTVLDEEEATSKLKDCCGHDAACLVMEDVGKKSSR